MPPAARTLMVWREDDRAGLVGYAADGQLPLFTVSWTTAIDEIGKGATLVVKSSLPGFEHQVWRAGTFDAAKDLAERVLRGWQQRVFGH
jgi:hypothetical protein